ncbi:MAG TPA: CvpA family protein [Bryobacteraceae bacterium]|nr:CvpA family protein [Bryobacteraceae bacterium]
MNGLDAVLLIILVVSVMTSFRKGLSREVIGLVTVFLALILGVWFYGLVGGLLIAYMSSPAVANLCGFFVVFLGTILLGALVSHVVGRFLKVTGLSIVDHGLGALFGLVRGTVIVVALLMAIMAFSPGEQPPQSVVNSRIAPYAVDAARFVVAMAPHDLKEGFRKTYAQVKTTWEDALRKGIPSAPKQEGAGHEREI